MRRFLKALRRIGIPLAFYLMEEVESDASASPEVLAPWGAIKISMGDIFSGDEGKGNASGNSIVNANAGFDRGLPISE
jgi:hypothetical protein